MEYRKRGSRPVTRKKYLDCLNDIQYQLNLNESVCLTTILKKHKVSNYIASVLKRLNVIQPTIYGYRWVSNEHMGKVVENVLWTISEHNKQKALYRKSVGIEKENEYVSNQPEAIFTFEPIPERVELKQPETIKTAPEEKVFEVSIFGMSIFKIKR